MKSKQRFARNSAIVIIFIAFIQFLNLSGCNSSFQNNPGSASDANLEVSWRYGTEVPATQYLDGTFFLTFHNIGTESIDTLEFYLPEVLSIVFSKGSWIYSINGLKVIFQRITGALDPGEYLTVSGSFASPGSKHLRFGPLDYDGPAISGRLTIVHVMSNF